MRLELAERLICPGAHARTPLIVVARRTLERDLLEADLGCMTCYRQAAIVEGDVLLSAASGAAHRAHGSQQPDVAAFDADVRAALDRLEAQLGLSEPGARVLLSGRYALLATALAASVEASVAILNAPSASAPSVGGVFLEEPMVPFSDGTFTAAALDGKLPEQQVTDALRTLQRGARVLGTWPLPLPSGVREIARDAVEWVGEREATPENIVVITRK